MSDGTVRGTFELDADQSIRTLRSIRDEGAAADASLATLGRRFTTVGTQSATMARKVSESWVATRKSIETESDRIMARLDGLQERMDRFGRTRASASVELAGFDRVNTQLSELEARLNRLNRMRAQPAVSLGGGFSNFAGGSSSTVSGAASSAGGGGGLGFASKLALAGLALTPAATGLVGGATALAGSATSAVLGAGTVGLGGVAPLAIGGGFSALAIKSTVSGLKALTTAQQAYNTAVGEYGAKSTQAATAQMKLNFALSQNPQAAGASRQLTLLKSSYASSFSGATNAAYRGESQVFYNARQALPALGRDATMATTATAGAAGDFTKFLGNTQNLTMLRQLTVAFAQDLPLAERALENMTTTLGHLAVAATPFFHEALQWTDHWSAGLAKSSGDTAAVQAKMQGYVSSAKDWARLTGAAFRTIRDIFSAGTPSGDSMVKDLTTTLDRWDAWINNNPQKVTGFFDQAKQTTEKIAGVIGTIVSDIAKLGAELSPIFNRAMDFIGFVSKLGPGGGVLGSLLYGGYQGARGAMGGKGPSAGALASSFVLGRPVGMGGGGARIGGGTVVGGGAAAEGALGGTRSYLAPRAQMYYPQGVGASQALDSRSALLLSGVFGVRSTAMINGETARMLQATPENFAATYGTDAAATSAVAGEGTLGAGVLGARYAGAVSTVAPRVSALSRLGGLGSSALKGAGRIALPLLAINSLLAAAGTKGNFGDKVVGGADSLLSTATLGLLPKASLQSLVGATNAGASLGNAGTQKSLRTLSTEAANVRTPAQMRAVDAKVQFVLGPGSGEFSPQDAGKIKTYMMTLMGNAAQNAGISASNTWQQSYVDALDRGQSPKKATATLIDGLAGEAKALGPKGAASFASSMAMWTSQLEAENPKLRKPLEQAMAGILDQVNQVHDKIDGRFGDLQSKIFEFNGAIFTGTDKTWAAIGAALTSHASYAQEKLQGIWGQIQAEAINALTQMGYAKTQAQQIVGNQAAIGSGAKNIQPLGPGAQHGGANARGGMISGDGLLDTVPVPGGGSAAPGEAWIANRHTMNDLSSATLAKYGKTAWQMIRDENRIHSAPLSSAKKKSGILPGFARGGRFATGGVLGSIGNVTSALGAAAGASGSLPGMIRTANIINSHHYPYEWGGGHNASFAPSPAEAGGPSGGPGVGYDCSGAVSAVLHGGGLLSSPETSGYFSSFGLPGPGTVTLYSSPEHVYMTIAGHGFGTSDSNPGGGADWFNAGPRPGFAVTHVPVNGSTAGIGRAAGGGLFAQSINVKAPMSGLTGIPGAMDDQASRDMTKGLDAHVNKVLSSSLGGLLGGSVGGIGAGMARGGRVHWGGWNARGAEFLTNGPTLFGAGEGGRREHVSVTPAGTPTGRGHEIHVHFEGPVHITSDKHMDEIGKHVAQKIMDALDAVHGGSDAQLMGMGAGNAS